MEQIQNINLQLQRLLAVPDWHFAIGLRIRFTHPTLLYQTYPEEWVTHYARSGLVFTDPVVKWGMTNFGSCDWDALAPDDTAGVLRQAANHGLRFGMVVSVGDVATRSLGFFARTRSLLTQDLRDLAFQATTNLHILTNGVENLPASDLAPLLALNDPLRRGVAPDGS